MNEQNLIQNQQRTPSERRESARRAGEASGKARREKSLMRTRIRAMLSELAVEHDGEKVVVLDETNEERIVAALLHNAALATKDGTADRRLLMEWLGESSMKVEVADMRKPEDIARDVMLSDVGDD